MILLADSTDPAYQAGQAFGAALFSIGVTIAIAYWAVQMLRNARRHRRNARAGIYIAPVMHVPPANSAYAGWGTHAPSAVGAVVPGTYDPTRRPTPPY